MHEKIIPPHIFNIDQERIEEPDQLAQATDLQNTANLLPDQHVNSEETVNLLEETNPHPISMDPRIAYETTLEPQVQMSLAKREAISENLNLLTDVDLRDKLYRYALRLTQHEQDAEDLVQDTLLKGFRFIGLFKTGTNFSAWIYKILMTTYLNDRRKFSAKTPIVSFDRTFNDDCFDGAQTDLTHASAEAEVFFGVLGEPILQAFKEIPQSHRGALVAFLLAELQEEKYKEIAERLDIPIGTVMSRISRMKARLSRIDTLMKYAKSLGYID